jgi:hypothetical protein
MHQFPVVDDCLQIGGIPLTQRAARVGQTPFYAYDRHLILAFLFLLSEHLSLFVKLLLAVGGIDRRLPFAVARLHLTEDLLERGVPPRQEVVQQRPEIPTAQQRSGLLVKPTLFQQEQHRHHDQGQVMVRAAASYTADYPSQAIPLNRLSDRSAAQSQRQNRPQASGRGTKNP